MKLSFKTNDKTNQIFLVLTVVMLIGAGIFAAFRGAQKTFAQDDSGRGSREGYFVTLDDGGETVTVRTDARTVGEVLERAGVILTEADVVNPGLEMEIDQNDFVISIWRARPVLIEDGVFRKYLLTTELDPREIVIKAGVNIYEEDEVLARLDYDFLGAGPTYVYEVERNHVEPEEEVIETGPEILESGLNVSPLTARRGVNQYWTTVNGVPVYRKETYYDLPMGGVMGIAARVCGAAAYYTVRADGVKVDAEGYVLVAADLNRYPRCSVVETSLGLGRVYDTGSFTLSNPEQFDLATDWTNWNGR